MSSQDQDVMGELDSARGAMERLHRHVTRITQQQQVRTSESKREHGNVHGWYNIIPAAVQHHSGCGISSLQLHTIAFEWSQSGCKHELKLR